MFLFLKYQEYEVYIIDYQLHNTIDSVLQSILNNYYHENKFFILWRLCTLVVEFNGLVSKRAVRNDGSFSI